MAGGAEGIDFDHNGEEREREEAATLQLMGLSVIVEQ